MLTSGSTAGLWAGAAARGHRPGQVQRQPRLEHEQLEDETHRPAGERAANLVLERGPVDEGRGARRTVE
jgi:hypothetical protein